MFKFLLIACIVGYCSPSKVFQTKAECVKTLKLSKRFVMDVKCVRLELK